MLEEADSLRNYRKHELDNYNIATGKKIDYSGTRYDCPSQRWYNNHDLYFIRNL